MKKEELLIKKYEKDGNYYKVEYINGEISEYYCTNDSHEQELIDKMLEQIKSEQSQEKIDKSIFRRNRNIVSATTATLLTSTAILSNEDLSGTVMMLVAYYSLCRIIKHQKRINELKKLKMFLEMNPYLDRINKSDFLKCIEFDNIYQTPLNINTIKDYSYGDVKTLYKKYKTINEKNNR